MQSLQNYLKKFFYCCLQLEGEQVPYTGGEISITRSKITNSIQGGIVAEEMALKSLIIVDTAISNSLQFGIKITGSNWPSGLSSLQFVLENCVINASRSQGLYINSYRMTAIQILNTTVSNSGHRAIEFYSYGTQKSLFVNHSKFSGSKFEGIYLYLSSPTKFVFENSAVREPLRSGILIYSYYRDNVVRIVNSSVTHSGDRGLVLWARYGRSGRWLIGGNTFAWNMKGAVSFNNYYYYYYYFQQAILVDSNNFFQNVGPTIEINNRAGGTVDIVNNAFTENSGFSVIAFGTSRGHYHTQAVVVRSNNFLANNCTDKAVIDIRSGAADFVISENDFVSNIGGCVLLEGTAVRRPISVTDNVFNQNDCDDKSVIEAQGMEENAKFSNNTFTQNMAKSVIHVHTLHNLDPSLHSRGFLFINNTLSNNFCNKSSSPLANQELCAFVLSGTINYKNTDFRFNKFDNFKYKRELCIRVPANSQRDVVNVSLNWWGTTTGSRVRDRISDFDVNHDFAITNNWPYLLSSDDQSDISIDGHNFKQQGNTLSGRLFESMALTASESPYFVTSDFTVLENVTLSIEAGVTVKVKPGSSILVAGGLKALGTLAKPVTFTVKEPNRTDDASRLTVRLVGGKFPWEGWLELFYNKSWKPLTAARNSSTGTIQDIVCKQLGYYPVATPLAFPNKQGQSLNWSSSMEVRCYGNETFLRDCLMTQAAFNNSGLPIAVKCPGEAWGNIRFTSSIHNTSQGQSTLEHVEFSFCGNHHGMSVPAIEAVINVPVLKFVTVRNCIAGGLRVYLPRTDVLLNNSKFINTGETGDGISFVQTGRKIVVENSESISNRIGLSIDESRTQNAPRVHYGQAFLCGEEESVLLKNETLLYFQIPLETKITASGTCRKVLTAPSGRGMKVKLLYSKGTQRLQIYGSINRRNLIFDTSNNHLASSVHKDLFIPRDTVLVQWTGDVSSQMAIQVEVTSVNGELLSY